MRYTELTIQQYKKVRDMMEDPTQLGTKSLWDIENRAIQNIFGVGRQDAYYGMLSFFRKDQTRLYDCEIRDGKLILNGNETTCSETDFIILLNVIHLKPSHPFEFEIGAVKYKEERDKVEKCKLLEIAFVQTIFSIWQDLQNKREDNAT